MGFGIVELNSAMTGIHDYTTIKHNEDAKGMVDQTNYQTQVEKSVEVKLTNVHQSDDANNRQKKFDARDKGSNEYSGDGGKKRDKKDEQDKKDGVVMPKSGGSFDIKI